MKNIAILIPTIKAGGAEKQAALLAISLSKLYNIYFVAFHGHTEESPNVRKMLEEANVNIIYLEGNLLKKSKEYSRFLKDYQIDTCFNYLTICDVLGSMIERKAGVKQIFNGIRNSKLAPVKLIAEWFAHNYIADYTIYNCYSGARYFESKGYNKSKTIVIPNCFPNISNPIKREKIGKKIIITVARFQPQKDYETTIRVIAEVKKYRQNFEFIIVGHGYLEPKIRQWVKDYGIEDCTTIHISPDNVQEILKSSDIYLSTSLYEGTSNSIMEAMNWSIPIVATNIGDNDQLVINEWNGFLSKIGDFKDLANHIVKLLDNDKLRVEIGLRGNERLHHYSVVKFVEKYKKLLE